MKIHGKKIEGPNIETIVIPRSNGEDIVFKVRSVLSNEDFDKLCPPPKPPKIQRVGGSWADDVEDAGYKASIEINSQLFQHWFALESLRATEGLEWETVKYNDPQTWVNWKKELTDSGLSMIEVSKIMAGINIANCLNETHVEEARKRFFMKEQSMKNGSSSQEVEQKNIPSGEPASV